MTRLYIYAIIAMNCWYSYGREIEANRNLIEDYMVRLAAACDTDVQTFSPRLETKFQRHPECTASQIQFAVVAVPR